MRFARCGWFFITTLVLSVYSTVWSGIWLGVACHQPRWGGSISTKSGAQMTPATASLITSLLAKAIEMSFVAVFVATLGQILTRKAISQKSKGLTLPRWLWGHALL